MDAAGGGSAPCLAMPDFSSAQWENTSIIIVSADIRDSTGLVIQGKVEAVQRSQQLRCRAIRFAAEERRTTSVSVCIPSPFPQCGWHIPPVLRHVQSSQSIFAASLQRSSVRVLSEAHPSRSVASCAGFAATILLSGASHGPSLDDPSLLRSDAVNGYAINAYAAAVCHVGVPETWPIRPRL